jgi:hypothetical protein
VIVPRTLVADASSVLLFLLLILRSDDSPVEAQVVGCPPPTGVVVTTSCESTDLDIAWTNGAAYTSILVDVIDSGTGAVVASVPLPGTASSTTVVPAEEGRYQVNVTGTCLPGATGSASSDVALFPFPIGTTNAVVDLDGDGGLVDSALALETALDTIQRETVRVDDIVAFSCRDQMGPGTVIWVALGTYPNNHVLTFDEGTLLVERLLAGVSIYIEGGDHWGFDPPTPLRDYDGVHGLAASGNVILDGDDSLAALVGLAHADLDFTALSGPYAQDSLGNDYTDQLIPTGAAAAPTDLLGANAGLVWQSSIGYGVAVYYLPPLPFVGPSPGKVLSSSFEFGGYGGEEDDAMQKMSDCLKGIVRDDFTRGDCNADGNCDIGDAIFLLGSLFGGGVAGSCESACDANDDGNIDIGDAIWKLSFLFSGGAAPPAPFAACGADPTPDGIGCAAFTACP